MVGGGERGEGERQVSMGGAEQRTEEIKEEKD